MSTTATREKPVLFSDAMVRAILDGRKTCTRRLVKHQPESLGGVRWQYRGSICSKAGLVDRLRADSPWKVGDRLWVREAFQLWERVSYEYDQWEIWDGPLVGEDHRYCEARYETTAEYRSTSESDGPWRPSIHMPRWASRINLTVVAVDPVQIQDLSDQEAKEEGVTHGWPISPHRAFVTLWESLYPGSWDRNDWVYANEFEIEKDPQ